MKHFSEVATILFIWFVVAPPFIVTSLAQNVDDLRFAGNGIDVDSDGRIRPLSSEELETLGKMMEDGLESIPPEQKQKVALRKISLRKLDTFIKNIIAQHEYLPDTVRYFGGLTNITYIAVVPDEQDLLLIGPAEGWHADHAGNIVGTHTGMPILMLEDFLTVLREWNRPIPSQTITCSFESTQETLTKLMGLHRQYTSINDKNADAYATALEEAYGDCAITITGVPASSRFAKVLVGADFQMKRIALGLEPSKTRGIPSYVGWIFASRSSISPRFLLVSEYAPSTHDSKKLTWRLGDLKVRASSQTMVSGGVDRAALTWCRRFEENYNTLSKDQPVFGELRNNMALAYVAALIHQEKLLQKAGCELTILLDETNLKLVEQPVPKSVAFRSVKRQNGSSTIVVCGGIEINPSVALQNNLRLDHRIDLERARLIETTGDAWWSP